MQNYQEIANTITNDFGANATYVEDLLRQFQHNPHSVGDEWGAYFTSLLDSNGAAKPEPQTVGPATMQAAKPSGNGATAVQPQAEAPAAGPTPGNAGERLQIRGPALKIVENM